MACCLYYLPNKEEEEQMKKWLSTSSLLGHLIRPVDPMPTTTKILKQRASLPQVDQINL